MLYCMRQISFRKLNTFKQSRLVWVMLQGSVNIVLPSMNVERGFHSFMLLYSYTPTTEEGVLKMHRSIRKADVTSEKLSDGIDTAQDEEVQYRSGRLERSSGNASFHLVKNSEADEEPSPMSLSQAFAATGSYTMELQACRKLSKDAFAVRKRRIMSAISQSLSEESLKANLDKSKFSIEVSTGLAWYYDTVIFPPQKSQLSKK